MKGMLFVALVLVIFTGVRSDILAQDGGMNRVFAVAWHPDDQIIAIGGKEVQLRRLYSNDVSRFLLNDDYVTSLAWKPDGSQLAVGVTANLNLVYILDGETLSVITSFEPGGWAYPQQLLWNRTGEYLAVLSDHLRGFRVYDTRTWQPAFHIISGRGVDREYVSLMWGVGQNELYASAREGNNGAVRVWDIATGSLLHEYFFDKAFQTLKLSSDQRLIAGLAADSEGVDILVWELERMLFFWQFEVPRGTDSSVLEWQPNTHIFSTLNFRRQVIFWDAESRTMRDRVQLVNHPSALTFDATGSLLAIGGSANDEMSVSLDERPNAAFVADGTSNFAFQVIVTPLAS
jgi:WD40 repeat protein